MATASQDYANGANGVNGTDSFPPARYSKVPPTITITVAEQEEGPIDIEISLDEDIQEDPDELCTLLENEQGAKGTWLTVAIAYAKHKKADVAIEVLQRAIANFTSAQERLSILSCLCWLYLFKCRQAPRLNQGIPAHPISCTGKRTKADHTYRRKPGRVDKRGLYPKSHAATQ